MSLQNFNILVVEDDPTLGKGIKAALSRAGFRSHWISNPANAIKYVKMQEVHGAIIDCMLPRMNGIELYGKIKENLSANAKVCMMSGIFKDKQFIKNSLKKTSADQFFTKPFEIQKITDYFLENFQPQGSAPSELAPLAQLYVDQKVSHRKLVKTLNGAEGLHNFDLPWVFKLIEASKVTGYLNIKCTNGDIAGVGFIKGAIVQANIQNEEPLLGLLLVDKGYLDREDLDKGLAKMSKGQRIGEVLTSNNFVSPHAVNIVLKDQLIWRLKRLIADSQMELNLVQSDTVNILAQLNSFDTQTFLVDTMDFVVRGDWLKTHYLSLSKNVVGIRSENEAQLNSYRYIPFVTRIFSFIEAPLREGTTLEEILVKNPQHETSILKAFHFLNIMGCLQFTQVRKKDNFSNQLARLKKLSVDLEEKSYFERLGLSRSAKDSDIKKAYHDLAKSLHPDKIDKEAPEELKEVSRSVFHLIQEAYDTLKNPESKATYLREIEIGQAEILMKADGIIEKAKSYLLKAQTTKAFPLLKEALQLNPDSVEGQILSIWCQIKGAKMVTDPLISDIDRKLQKIPLESRDIASYYHTKGLYFKMLDDHTSAIKYFKTALSRDSAYINSRRELTLLENSKEKKSIFQADIKDVVGMFFKKR